MKYLLTTLSIFLFLPANGAVPSPIGNAPGWTYKEIEQNSFEARFSGGAEAMLTLGETGKIPDSTVLIYSLPIPPHSHLAGDTGAWQKIFFTGNGRKQVIINQRAILVNKEWRYIVSFQTDTGTETMLSSALMAKVVGNKIRYFLYENPPSAFKDSVATVWQLYRTCSGG